jgi:hypothetical protein
LDPFRFPSDFIIDTFASDKQDSFGILSGFDPACVRR